MPGPVFLEGDRVELRTFEEEDLVFLRDTVNDARVWPSIGGQTLPSNLEQERKFFQDLNRDDDAVLLLVTVEERRVGIIELEPINWENGVAEVAFLIAPEEQHQGFATDALETIVDYSFEHLRMHKLTAESFTFNEASRDLLERVGFSREGELRQEAFVDGEHTDVMRFGLLVEEWEASG